MWHLQCHTALHLQSFLRVTSVCKKSSARAWGRLKLPSAPSPFSQEDLAAVRSVGRTRQPVRRRPKFVRATPDRCCRSANSPGTVWPVVVHATDRTAPSTSCESGDGAYGCFERPLARALSFLHTEVTCERTFQMQCCMASKMSNNAWVESLCQHYGHALTGSRVRTTDRTAAARTAWENGDGADRSF